MNANNCGAKFEKKLFNTTICDVLSPRAAKLNSTGAEQPQPLTTPLKIVVPALTALPENFALFLTVFFIE